MEEIEIIHFNNGSKGGVLSVIQNMLKYKQNQFIKYTIIYTINTNQTPTFELPNLIGAEKEYVFHYSDNWNLYHTCKKLSKYIRHENVILIAHDYLELCMISSLGLKNPVIQFIHGNYDYYFNMSIDFEIWINQYIAVSDIIRKKLLNKLPNRTVDIHYQRFPIPYVDYMIRKNTISRVVFLGRCTEMKGYFMLPAIASKLIEYNIKLEWTIIGEGSDAIVNQKIWPSSLNVSFLGEMENDAILKILNQFDYIVLPSLAEGMPISIIEAMKAGVIPITNDLESGLQEVIINEQTGFRIASNKLQGYVDIIHTLENNKVLKESISLNAHQLASSLFDPLKNTECLENIFLSTTNSLKKSIKRKNIGSRLDHPYIPNFFTKNIRYYAKFFFS